MKITTILLLSACLSASAGSLAQRVTLLQKNVKLKEVFKEIKKQTGYVFFYDTQILQRAKPVDIDVENVSVEEALKESLREQPFDFSIEQKTITIFQKPGYSLYKRPVNDEYQNMETLAPLNIINGTVKDAQGNPLIGVSVIIKGTTKGTSTNTNGSFSIDANVGDVLEFTIVGYQKKSITVGQSNNLSVVMEIEASIANEVVVVGYGTQKELNVTGAISTVGSNEIESRSVNNSVQALQGLAPNLNISANSDGGEADATVNLNIRGQGSLSSSAPYILIDGIRATQSEFANLNPNDIENISILKDAASASIYGAHAAFGVILVETKKGNKNKFSINYSNSVRIKKRIFVPDFVNSVEYAKVANEAGRNFNGQETFSQEQIQMMQDFIDGKLGKYGTAENPNNPNQWLGIGDGSSNGWLTGYANTDWWKIMYKDVDITQKHDLSFRGGGEKWTYYVSGGILSDPGQLRYGDKSEYFSRQNLNSNISVNVTKWLKLTNIGRVTKTRNSFPATLEGASRGRLYHDIMRFSPNIPWRTPPVVDNDGEIIVPEQLDFLPGFNENNGFDKYTNFEFLSSFRAEIKITKDLVLNGDYSFKRNTHEETLNYKRWDLLGPDGAPSITYQKNNNQIRKDWSRLNYESFNIYANYKKSLLNGHNLDLLLGYQQEESNSEGLTAGRMMVVGSDLNSINTAVGEIIQPNNPIESFATVGAFGRFSYNYQQKYLVEFQGRYDGSSKFAPGHRFGIFPSVSLGYNLDRENYWKALEKVVNRLKIRASWGKLGNQEVTGYLFQPAISISTQLPWVIDGERPVYVNPPNIVSPNITWETSSTLNFGIDASFAKNRLSGSFDIYTRKVDNMFGPIAALPATLGVDPPETNSASLKTQGWEFTLGWRDQEGSISYNARLMLSRNRTIVTRYNNPEKVIGFRYEGEVLGEIWGYEANSLFQSEEEVTKYLSAVDLNFLGTNWQPGDVKYLDLNEDGKVNNGNNTVSNPGDRRIIGNSNPQFQISFLGGISWKNFDLDLLFQGVGKTGVFMDDYATLLWGWNSQPHTHLTQKAIDNMWTKENPGGYLPIQLSSGGRSGFTKDRFPSTRYLLNGSYLRLKSLDIGYTLNATLAKKLRLNKLRVFVAGENLVTFTKMWSTFDPELAVTGTRGRTSDGRAYPLARVFSFGLDVSF